MSRSAKWPWSCGATRGLKANAARVWLPSSLKSTFSRLTEFAITGKHVGKFKPVIYEDLDEFIIFFI